MYRLRTTSHRAKRTGDFIEEDIHEMIATSKGTRERFLRARRIDMTVEVIHDRITSQQTSDTGTDTQTLRIGGLR